MDTKKYEQYAEIRRQIAQLEEVAELLKKDIVEDMEKLPVTDRVFKIEAGTFTMKTRKNYVFSPEIQEKEENLKIEKAQAIDKGEALTNETYYLEFKIAK